MWRYSARRTGCSRVVRFFVDGRTKSGAALPTKAFGTSKIACLVLKFENAAEGADDGLGALAGQSQFRVIGAATTRSRGVRFEQSIPDEYLARLADAYARFFYQYEDAPLLIINSERLDFVHDPAHFRMLLDRVANMRGRREFFNLGQG